MKELGPVLLSPTPPQKITGLPAGLGACKSALERKMPVAREQMVLPGSATDEPLVNSSSKTERGMEEYSSSQATSTRAIFTLERASGAEPTGWPKGSVKVGCSSLTKRAGLLSKTGCPHLLLTM